MVVLLGLRSQGSTGFPWGGQDSGDWPILVGQRGAANPLVSCLSTVWAGSWQQERWRTVFRSMASVAESEQVWSGVHWCLIFLQVTSGLPPEAAFLSQEAYGPFPDPSFHQTPQRPYSADLPKGVWGLFSSFINYTRFWKLFYIKQTCFQLLALGLALTR